MPHADTMRLARQVYDTSREWADGKEFDAFFLRMWLPKRHKDVSSSRLNAALKVLVAHGMIERTGRTGPSSWGHGYKHVGQNPTGNEAQLWVLEDKTPSAEVVEVDFVQRRRVS